ncbi:MAG TPA: oligopeptidase A, partial [Polymorphobacter sp.]|nr:oligopeptidase A [Polymorphobacter sp.]
MTDTNPLLADTDLPDFAAIRPEHVVPATLQLIADHRAAIAAIADADDFACVILPAEAADFALTRGWSPVTHLTGVADTPELRAAHAEAEAALIAYMMEAGQNRAQHAAIQRVADRADFALLTPAQRRAVELALRGFRLSGVALEGPARARFLDIGVELSKLGTQFGNAVLDATEAWSEHITDEAALAGLSDNDKAMLAGYATEKGLTGWLVTLRQPSVSAVLGQSSLRGMTALFAGLALGCVGMDQISGAARYTGG